MEYWGAGMRRRELGLALLLMMMASSLPDTAECATFTFSLSDLSLGKVFNGIVQRAKSWVNKFVSAEKWWKSLGRKLEQITFRSKRHFDQWYSWLKRAAAAPFTTRNPTVRCVKAAWHECLVRNRGLAFASGLWCSWIIYVECDMAHGGYKRPWTGFDPFYNEGKGVPPSRLYRHRRKDHPYGI
ncbi:hypothetical protein ACLOJK_002267 [Asimina triloba]